MKFHLRFAREAADELTALRSAAQAARSRSAGAKPSKQAGLVKQLDKALMLLSENPRHPGLQTHEFNSIKNPLDPRGKVFEAYAQNRTAGAYRIFWCYGPGQGDITIIAITPHP